LEQQKFQLKAQGEAQKSELSARDAQTQLAMKGQEHNMKMQQRAQEIQLSAAEAEHKQRIFSAEAQAKMIQELQHKEVGHQVDMRHKDEAGRQKVAAAKQQAKVKPKKGAK